MLKYTEMLSDTFTHAVVNFVTGKRLFIGQLGACENMLNQSSCYMVVRLRPRSIH